MVWNISMAIVLAGLLVFAIRGELGQPEGDPHAIAARVAPQVGVSASLLEKELATELEHRPAAGVAFPACILIVLLVVRAVLDWRHRRQQMQQAAAISRTRTLVWDAALLAVAVLLFLFSIGVGNASPFAVGSAVAEDIAPRLGVAAQPLMQALTLAMLEGAGDRSLTGALPLCLPIVLLAVRLVLDLRGADKSKQL